MTEYSEDKLNLFIDEQLDSNEMDAMHRALLEDPVLRERVCQLRAVRELVGYAYAQLPEPGDRQPPRSGTGRSMAWRGIAASLLIAVGVVLGWFVNDRAMITTRIASASDVFQYFKHKLPVDRKERKIILHVTTGDIAAVDSALNEAEQLLASYRASDTPMRLDIIAYKDGINMLRADVSPYVNRIEHIIDANTNVTIYACQNSIRKAKQREGRDFALMPAADTSKTAQELISERLQKGWIYIKV